MSWSNLSHCLLAFLVALAMGACGEDNPAGPGRDNPDSPAGFVRVPAGSFIMGSPDTEPGHKDIEVEHAVSLTRSFWMQTTEVTNAQYLRLARWAIANGLARVSEENFFVLRDTGAEQDFFYVFRDFMEIGYDAAGDSIFLRNIGQGIRPDNPVAGLTWWGAAAYCDWLSLSEGREALYDHETWQADLTAAAGYRLPTEAEWEYAARAGSRTTFPGSQISDLTCGPDSLRYQAWYCSNAPDGSKPVGQLWPNAFGLYDMHGNLWEYCNDWFDPEYYGSSPAEDPPGPATGQLRIARGGAWGSNAVTCRSAQRGVHLLRTISLYEGLRPILIIADEK